MKRSEFLQRVESCHNVQRVEYEDFWKYCPQWDRVESYSAYGKGNYVLLIDRASFGDYHGSAFVERINFDILYNLGCSSLNSKYGKTLYIPHNLRGIRSEDLDEICEKIESLEDYPCLDDCALSMAELEAYQEYWIADGSRNYWKHIRSMPCFEEIEDWEFFEHCDLVYELGKKAFEAAMEKCLFSPESGKNVHCDEKRIGIDDSDIQAILALYRENRSESP